MQPVLASVTSAASSADNSWTASLERFFNDGAKILDDAAGYLFLYLLAWLLVLGGPVLHCADRIRAAAALPLHGAGHHLLP